jgi:uncharacterized protein (TIGR02099 family)
MSAPLRLRLRRIRRHAVYAMAIVLVCVALLVGSVSQLLPVAERHPDKVAAWLSARAGQPVRFDQLQTRWTRRGPLLALKGLRIGEGQGLRIGEAEVLVSMYAGLLPGHSLTELRLRGLALVLQRAPDGRWSVQGLPQSTTGGDPLDALRRLGELQVIGGRLRVDAPSLGLQAELPRIDLRLRVDGQRLRVGARAWADPQAMPLTAVVDFERSRGDGQVWLGADPADFRAWSRLLQFGGVSLQEGTGELNAWVDLRDHRPVMISTDADLHDVQLRGAALADGKRPTLQLDTLQLRARWRWVQGGWRADAPRLRIGMEGRTEQLDGLLIAGGQHMALAGDNIDATALLRGLALSDRIDPGLRNWLHDAAPQVRMTRVRVAGERDGALSVEGELEEIRFAAAGHAPGISGVGGHFDGDANGFRLALQPTRTMHFDWPTGFGVRHDVRLAGSMVGWRDEGGGWRIGTPALRVQGTDYAADVRGTVWFQGNGTRPWLQLAAKIDDVPMTAAKRFWIHSKMSKAATDWLDAALVGGYVRGGVGLVTGDLEDWPFNNHNGRFEATGRIDNGNIRFQRDWPTMNKVDGDIAFIGPGFELHGRGDLAGVAVDHFDAGIADFGASQLYVKATSRSDAGALLAMLKQSPLHKTYADSLDNLTAKGPAAVTFDLLQPLHHGEGGGHLQGTVELDGATLTDKRFALTFDAMRGKANYSQGGFGAEALAVRHLGHDGQLSLRAGGYVRDPLQAFESELTASLDAGLLLDRAPELAWLKPYIQGTSRWTIGVTLPRVAPGSKVEAPTLLRLHSDLVGTRLDLPAPLDKPAETPLATAVNAQLPMGAGRVDVAFGQRLALAARTHNNQTGVQVTLGSDKVDREPPASGLVVNGRSGSLDALDWIALARSPGGAPDADPMPLRQVDVQVGQLLLAGGVFADTRLQLRPSTNGVDVRLDGPALAGSLNVPSADGAAIVGKLDRVHWQSPPTPVKPPGDGAPILLPTGSTLPARVQASANDTNPAKIPPLSLDIDDLQFGKARLGQAVLRTRPFGNGLSVDQLQFRAPKQEIDIQGRWLGMGEAARTQVQVKVDSEDLGGLMQNLDYGGQLRGGQGQISLDAGWQGGPSDFQLGALQGQMQVHARNGQLLELEPGAGRVLGLLSVTQLPRRLMFDFRDFFSKGFAFNQIEGTLAFANGMATTDKVLIEGPAANINIRGQTDLRRQQFDQTIDVNPRAGNLLTVVGAVAGGPIGAAVGAAANAVLSKPLGEIGAKTYRVTGPWAEPKVEVIDRDSAPPPPAATPRPAAR